jgi:hypothetical protein
MVPHPARFVDLSLAEDPVVFFTVDSISVPVRQIPARYNKAFVDTVVFTLGHDHSACRGWSAI